jgi:hypothetical protein
MPQPSVIAKDIFEMFVCVPPNWETKQVERFASESNKPRHGFEWKVAKFYNPSKVIENRVRCISSENLHIRLELKEL